jgi:hypothetical protein
VAALLLGSALGPSCTLRRELVDPTAAYRLDGKAPVLKAHMRDGAVFVLEHWTVDEPHGVVRGSGVEYDLERRVAASGDLQVPLPQVALFETNAIRPDTPTVAALTVVTVTSLALTGFCAISPKTCFGSCPTFYVDGDSQVAAEAFSSSVAPALEARDVDALFRARPRGRQLRLRVTNEALETHVIRQADVLAAPRPPGGRVLAAADGSFWQARGLRPPLACHAPEGDCLAKVAAADERERSTGADPQDLAARETIELAFAPPPGGGPLGLVIEARQTFITTFLFYQSLAYLGRQAGPFLAAVERGDTAMRDRAERLYHLLGGIEVEVPDGRGGWKMAGAFEETGPIAREVQVIPLPPGTVGDHLRLRLTRGHWRLGHAALASLAATVVPVRLPPTRVVTRAGDGQLAADWVAGRRPALVTGPGDEHELFYTLPDDPDRVELFLSARGYYLEWMRQPWLEEENPRRAALLLDHPERALREMAPAFKKLEPQIEDLFWKSRYVRAAAP